MNEFTNVVSNAASPAGVPMPPALIAAVRAGEEVVICQAGKPVARLAAFEPARKKPRLGTFKGKIKLSPDWDSPETNAEIEALMLGEEPPKR